MTTPDSYTTDHVSPYAYHEFSWDDLTDDEADSEDAALNKELANKLVTEMEELINGQLFMPTGGVTARKRSEFFDGRNHIRIID